jgi:hypothetical protein
MRKPHPEAQPNCQQEQQRISGNHEQPAVQRTEAQQSGSQGAELYQLRDATSKGTAT